MSETYYSNCLRCGWDNLVTNDMTITYCEICEYNIELGLSENT